jgi:hypothetical protein
MNPNTGNPEQSADELTYFSNMSRAMARHCDVFASLMSVAKTDPKGIPQNGIWNLVEFPELMLANNAGGTVNDVSFSAGVCERSHDISQAWLLISFLFRSTGSTRPLICKENCGIVSASRRGRSPT